MNPTLPVITTMTSPNDIRLSEPVRSEKMPHLAFSNVEVQGPSCGKTLRRRANTGNN